MSNPRELAEKQDLQLKRAYHEAELLKDQVEASRAKVTDRVSKICDGVSPKALDYLKRQFNNEMKSSSGGFAVYDYNNPNLIRYDHLEYEIYADRAPRAPRNELKEQLDKYKRDHKDVDNVDPSKAGSRESSIRLYQILRKISDAKSITYEAKYQVAMELKAELDLPRSKNSKAMRALAEEKYKELMSAIKGLTESRIESKTERILLNETIAKEIKDLEKRAVTDQPEDVARFRKATLDERFRTDPLIRLSLLSQWDQEDGKKYNRESKSAKGIIDQACKALEQGYPPFEAAKLDQEAERKAHAERQTKYEQAMQAASESIQAQQLEQQRSDAKAYYRQAKQEWKSVLEAEDQLQSNRERAAKSKARPTKNWDLHTLKVGIVATGAGTHLSTTLPKAKKDQDSAIKLLATFADPALGKIVAWAPPLPEDMKTLKTLLEGVKNNTTNDPNKINNLEKFLVAQIQRYNDQQHKHSEPPLYNPSPEELICRAVLTEFMFLLTQFHQKDTQSSGMYNYNPFKQFVSASMEVFQETCNRAIATTYSALAEEKKAESELKSAQTVFDAAEARVAAQESMSKTAGVTAHQEMQLRTPPTQKATPSVELKEARARLDACSRAYDEAKKAVKENVRRNAILGITFDRKNPINDAARSLAMTIAPKSTDFRTKQEAKAAAQAAIDEEAAKKDAREYEPIKNAEDKKRYDAYVQARQNAINLGAIPSDTELLRAPSLKLAEGVMPISVSLKRGTKVVSATAAGTASANLLNTPSTMYPANRSAGQPASQQPPAAGKTPQPGGGDGK